MTKLAVLSDIHGNLPALEAIISDFRVFDIDHVIVPGDVIENGWSVIRGNNEYFLIDYGTPAQWAFHWMAYFLQAI